MTLRRQTLALALAVTAAVPHAWASPVLIRDELIRDKALSPALGRGYSLATNTFQSTCLADAPKVKPSYDFIYEFSDEDESRGPAPTGTGEPPKLDGIGTAVVDTTGKTFYKHSMRFDVKIFTYYASLDEAKAKLSDAATKLLTTNDLPGFFDSCGVYYTRTITRRSTYLSIFEYQTESKTKDKAFEQMLKDEVTKLSAGAFSQVTQAVTNTVTNTVTPPTPPPTTTPPTTTTTPPTTTPPTTTTTTPPTTTPPTVTPTANLTQQISTRKTTIRSFGYGLGKDPTPGDGLIAYDLETFKSAVKLAFKAMQNDDVGIVDSIEVVPWVENTLFQSSVALQPREIDDPAKPGQKLVMSPYVQKRILSQNSEFLGEIDRSSRTRLVNYYRGRMCRLTIEQSYGTFKGNRWDISAKATTPLVNNRTGTVVADDQMTLGKLYDDGVSTNRLKALLDEYEAFTYKAAQQCFDQLLTNDFTIKHYRGMPACAGLESQFSVVSGRVIDDYCLPTPAGGTKP